MAGYSAPPYEPAPNLHGGSFLTADQLVFNFQEFYSNLVYLDCAPSYVFELLVGSLNDIFTATIEKENLRHTTAIEQQLLQHTAALEQERIQHADALEKERLRHAATLEQESHHHAAALEQEVTQYVNTLEQQHLQHDNALKQQSLQHINVLKQKQLEHERSLEQERLRHADALEQERAKSINALENEKKKAERTNTLERDKNATASEKLREEIKTLQSTNTQLREEVTRLKEQAVVKKIVPVSGSFYTHEIWGPMNPRIDTSKTVTFTKPYPVPPALSVGFNLLDIGKTDNVRVEAQAQNIRANTFDIRIHTWGGPLLRDVGCTWLEVPTNDPDFQTGTYATIEDHSHLNPQSIHTRVITFPRAYLSSPRVVVWLNLLDLPVNLNRCLKAYETNVTATGFTMHIDTWADSVLYYATASWVAYPANKPNTSSGRFAISDTRPAKCPQLYNSGYVDFGKDVFTSPPRVMLAINTIDIDKSQDLRLAVKASSINAAGMTWHLDSWDDTILYNAGASYIAFG